MGGYDHKTLKKVDTIYYAMSRDLCDDKNKNVWQKSKITLPYALSHCKCMINHKNTSKPKLLILGGIDEEWNNETKTFLEFDLRNVIGNQTYFRFVFDSQKVQ